MSAKGTTVEADQSESAITNYLLDNPRMIGVLFTILLLITQAANGAAQASSTAGP